MIGGRAAIAPLAAAGVGAAAVAFTGAAAQVGGQREFGAAAAVRPHLAHQQGNFFGHASSAIMMIFLVTPMFTLGHRRRINTEEKANVVAAAWGAELSLFL